MSGTKNTGPTLAGTHLNTPHGSTVTLAPAGSRTRVRRITALIASLLIVLTSLISSPTIAHAAGDDYPYKNAAPCGDSAWCINGRWYSDWGFAYRNCTDFVAWRMRATNGVDFYNTMRGGRWGNANTWDDNARRLGYAVDNTPARGAIAQTDAGAYGHVAWVSAVNGDGTVGIEEYNYGFAGNYRTRTVSAGSFRYIHIRDLPTSHAPDGRLDAATGGPGTVSLRGWALDRDAATTPIEVHVYIGAPVGSAGAEGHNIGPASGHRADVGAAFPGVGDYHGYDKTVVTSKRGRQMLYVYAINQGPAGSNPLIGQAEVTVGDPNPVSNLDQVSSPSGEKVRVTGWAFDPNSPKSPVRIHAYVGGPAGSGERHDLGSTSVERSDVAQTHPQASANSGFDFTFSTTRSGRQTVYVYALNVDGTPGENVLIGSKAVTLAEPALTRTPAPTIKGTARVGQRLFAKPGTWSPAPVILSYQWKADGTAIPGATDAALTVPASAKGKKIAVTVTGSKPGYISVAKTSKATKKVAAGTLKAPTPKITGTAKVGQPLTANPGAWTPSDATLTYQWYRNGKKIKAATASNYTLVKADKGKKITVKVTGKKDGYTSLTKTSKKTGKVK